MAQTTPLLAQSRRRPRLHLALAEPPPDPIGEADLSAVWQAQRYPVGALRTADGAPVLVLYPGRGGGAGPDFRDAVVVVRGQRMVGDVELHVRASYFQAHGHHLDAAYDGVVLHVVYLDDGEGETRLASGGRAPVAAFAPWVGERAAALGALLAGSRPAAAPRALLWREPCADAARRLGDERVDAVLAAAGRERFLAKAAAVAAGAEAVGPEEALWQALLDALAIGGDRDGFRRLGLVLPAAVLRRLTAGREEREAASLAAGALLAVAGLGAAPPEMAAGLPPALLPPVAGGAGRPANRPGQRLIAAGHLFARARDGLAAYAAASAAGDAKALMGAWQVGGETGRGPALVGEARAREIVVNAVLPFLASQPGGMSSALALLTALTPAPAYGRSRFLESNVVRTNGSRRLRSALAQQGLLALQARWCSQGGCGICPLS